MFITEKSELEKYSTSCRLWQGIPGVEVTPAGRVFVTFYSGGTREEIGNFVVLLKDDGEGFGEPIAVAYEPEHRCYDPCLWRDPLGRLWFFWAVMPEHAVWCVVCDKPDAAELKWSKPRVIAHDVMMNKPTVLTTGEWLFPVAIWENGVRVLPAKYDTVNEPSGSLVYKSGDNGEHITLFGKADMPERSYDEHMILERNDMCLMMFVRTKYGIGVSFSWDRGRTWSRGEDSDLGGPSSRFFIKRLKSGRILLINHVNFTGRNNLTALLSDDECATWKWKLLLDGRSDVSYPDATEDANGNIYIVYDRERGAFKNGLEEVYKCAREILISRITEKDIMRGRLESPDSYLKKVVSRLGEYGGADKNPFAESDRFDDAGLASWILEIVSGEEAIDRLFALYPINCRSLHRFDAEKFDKLAERFCAQGGDDKKMLTDMVALVRSCSTDSAPDNPIIDLVIKDIRANIGREVSVTQLAKKYDISVFYLCHLFKQTTGMSVTQCCNELRLAMAKKLLVETDDKISDIALSCGYNSYSYFTEVFVHDESMTPSRFRKLHSVCGVSNEEEEKE